MIPPIGQVLCAIFSIFVKDRLLLSLGGYNKRQMMKILFRNTSELYGLVAIFLHWLIAIALMMMFGMGKWMVSLPVGSEEQFVLYQLHKSVGITILVLSLLRLWWRCVNPQPILPDTVKPWERFIAGFVVVAFYGLMIGIPLSGWIMVSVSPLQIPTIIYHVIPLPAFPFLEAWRSEAMVTLMQDVHETLNFLMVFLLVLHVCGAFKHHFIDKNNVLLRMFYKTR